MSSFSWKSLQDAAGPVSRETFDRLVAFDFTVHRSTGIMHTVLGGVGPETDIDPLEFAVLDGVKEAHRIASPYKLASRSFRPGGTVVRVRDVEIGGTSVVTMAGPCSIENPEQIASAAEIAAIAVSGSPSTRAR